MSLLDIFLTDFISKNSAEWQDMLSHKKSTKNISKKSELERNVSLLQKCLADIQPNEAIPTDKEHEKMVCLYEHMHSMVKQLEDLIDLDL